MIKDIDNIKRISDNLTSQQKIKHLIITRFLSCNGLHMTKQQLFSDEILENGYRLLTTYLLRSLQSQTNQNLSLY